MIVSYNSVWPYYSSPALLALGVAAAEFFDDLTLAIWILYALVPILDLFYPLDIVNPTPEEQKIMKNEWKWKFPLYTWFVLDYLTLFWLLQYTANREFTWVQTGMALFLSATLAQGSINVSHECMHKKDKIS